MHLPHPLLGTQNVEIKEHEAFGWKIGNNDRRGRIKKYIKGFEGKGKKNAFQH